MIPGDATVRPGEVVQHMGLRTRFMSLQDAMGASAGCIAQHAAWAVVHGLANYVVCSFGSNERSLPPRSQPGARMRGGGYGMIGAPGGYAMAARRGMHELGTGPETWKEIAVTQRRWANLNPRATMYNRIMSYEDYYSSPVIVEPFRVVDCCLVSDSGKAFIVTTAERARDCRKPPVYIMGMGQDHPATDLLDGAHLAGNTGAKVSGEEAYKMAGITKDDIDACEIYDCFTYTVEVTLMDYGFFSPGEGKDFLKAERLGPGGDLPLNTSGGMLSEVYQMGFTPVSEAVVQLRGEAGERQLGPATKTKEPKIIMVSCNGGLLSQHSTLILRR
jgi:acetyl-CoA acetyltransferase